MKLTSFRSKDETHLKDLDGAGLISPEIEAGLPEVLRARTTWLAELCKQRGYRFAPRLHIELYGNRRGT